MKKTEILAKSALVTAMTLTRLNLIWTDRNKLNLTWTDRNKLNLIQTDRNKLNLIRTDRNKPQDKQHFVAVLSKCLWKPDTKNWTEMSGPSKMCYISEKNYGNKQKKFHLINEDTRNCVWTTCWTKKIKCYKQRKVMQKADTRKTRSNQSFLQKLSITGK